jgi:hypothetical protein
MADCSKQPRCQHEFSHESALIQIRACRGTSAFVTLSNRKWKRVSYWRATVTSRIFGQKSMRRSGPFCYTQFSLRSRSRVQSTRSDRPINRSRTTIVRTFDYDFPVSNAPEVQLRSQLQSVLIFLIGKGPRADSATETESKTARRLLGMLESNYGQNR